MTSRDKDVGMSVARPEPIAGAAGPESGVPGALTMVIEQAHADVGLPPGHPTAIPRGFSDARPGSAPRSRIGRRGVARRVRDTGIGLSPEMLPRVFDLFAQADRSLVRAQGGLGIGLTLVRSLVEMHGRGGGHRAWGARVLPRPPYRSGYTPIENMG
jgi:Histidine kinase-, DNA gyrase B-, and HSP90-like ATPase